MLHHGVLHDDAYQVPYVGRANWGVRWLRSHVVRFSHGEAQVRRRELIVDLLAATPPDRLCRSGDHVATVASALGLPRSVSDDVRVVAACYQPHMRATPAADEAVERLVASCGGVWDEQTAARICVLVQACDATARLIDGHVPPVAATRRIDPDGAEVMVDLSGAWFGAGRHACPAEAHAAALTDGVGRFRALHTGPELLVLPNAWDVASAQLFVAAGFSAVGTTSLGVAAANGLRDGIGLTREVTLRLASLLGDDLPVPVTVDVEDGWGDDPGDLASEVWELGVAGVNIEDGRGDHLVPAAELARLIVQMKHAAPHLFVNARIDTYWVGCDHASTIDRARAYEAAGADGVFVPGADEDTVAAVVRSVDVPVNVLADRPLERWRELGVRRVSSGSTPYRSALAAAAAAVEHIRAGQALPPTLDYGTVNALAPIGCQR